MVADGSAVFTGHRPLGYVTNHVPLVTRYITRRWALWGGGMSLINKNATFVNALIWSIFWHKARRGRPR